VCSGTATPKYDTAAKISKATRGKVTVAEVFAIKPVPAPRRRSKRTRVRKSKVTAAAA
jgi:hypothetical protein